MNPTRINTCSINTEKPSLNILTSGSNAGLIFSLIIYGILTKLSFLNNEQILIRHAITVPKTVAIAAPLIPSAGNPK